LGADVASASFKVYSSWKQTASAAGSGSRGEDPGRLTSGRGRQRESFMWLRQGCSPCRIHGILRAALARDGGHGKAWGRSNAPKSLARGWQTSPLSNVRRKMQLRYGTLSRCRSA